MTETIYPLRLSHMTVEEYIAGRVMQARDLGCSEDYCARLATQLLERSKIEAPKLEYRR